MDEPDKTLSRWLLEFLLRNSDDEPFAKRALAVLPIPDDDPRLKKTVLLRTIEYEVSEGLVTSTALENLELIEELDSRRGSAAAAAGDSMKAAYCAVALDCTVRVLVGNGGKPGGKFLNAVKRIWRGRVGRMEKSAAARESRLLSSDLRRCWDEVEAAIWDEGVCRKLMRINTRKDALMLLGAYLKEAWALMGPSFVAWAARLSAKQRFREDGNGEESRGRGWSLNGLIELRAELRDEVGLRELANDRVRENVVGDGVVLPDSDGLIVIDEPESTAKAVDDGVTLLGNNTDLAITNGPATTDKEVPREKVVLRSKHVGFQKRIRGPVRISDVEDLETDASPRRFNSIPTPEVNEAHEALKSSSLDLQAAVTDPLPEAVREAETVVSDLTTKNVIHEHPLENQRRTEADAANPSIHTCTEPVQSCDVNLGNPSSSYPNNVPRPSLMERNNTAHTYEWDDSIDDSPEAMVNCKDRLHLPSPKKRALSPLKKYEPTKLCKRRKVKRWTLLEEDTLRDGVQKYGKGNWKLILKLYSDIFEERTEVDLKDKWRNMTR
ncbi:uncharacterized protein LOC21393956 isoform X1 [Morus notabilis]|uniref:uncharacterized protein LOC21393956 isoform X1 n=1 Tax=Morus notabilis TaxID=981085 RepID=UPI000CECEF28|nr:uncharacterized protein LOC21393956 isoform X1 [Morus notabilis]